MTKDEVYSIILELRKNLITNHEYIYTNLTEAFDFFTQNQSGPEEIKKFFLEFQNEILINDKHYFNKILELIDQID